MIRSATKDDLKVLLDLEDTCFTSDIIDEQAMRRYLRNNGASCHVLVWEGTEGVDGYILLQTARRSKIKTVIHSFAVHPWKRGTGSGKALLEEAVKISKQLGYHAIMTHVRVDNPNAISRYKKSGFKITGAVPNYYEDGCDAVKYTRKLNGT